MAHYALIDSNNIVTSVITGVDENITQVDLNGETVGGSSEAWETFYASLPWNEGLICKRTSYNNAIRKRFAGPGFTYDAVNDVFIAPQPFKSWTLDSNHDWQPPIPMPADNNIYFWSDTLVEWVLVGSDVNKTVPAATQTNE